MVPGTGAVLMLDCDAELRDALRNELLKHDLVAVAADTQEMTAVIRRVKPVAISLEIDASAGDAALALSQVRDLTDVPLMVVCEKGTDRTRLLDLGADDIMCKPLDLPEWAARLRALLRRAGSERAAIGPTIRMSVGGWAVDRSLLKVTAPDGRDCDLTATEFVVFDALSRNVNRVLTREQIRDLVRGPHWSANERLVDNQIGRLRRKLAANAIDPPIKTVRGSGYMLSIDADDVPELTAVSS